MGIKSGAAVNLPEVQNTPTTPAGHVSIYGRGDHEVYSQDAAGVESNLHNRALVVAGDDAPPYFDGSTPATATHSHHWLGTPHLSRSEQREIATGAVVATNYCSNSSFEATLTGSDDYGYEWHSSTALGYFAGLATLAPSVVGGKEGGSAARVHWPASSPLEDDICTIVGNLIPGNTYVASIWVYIPFGSPDVRLNCIFFAISEYTEVRESWVRLTATFVPNATEIFIGVNTPGPSVGGECTIDGLLVTEAVEALNDVTTVNFQGAGVTVTPGAAGEAVVTMPGFIENQPGALMYMSAVQQIPHGATTTLLLDTASFAIPPSFVDPVGHALVIPQDGLYIINCYVSTDSEPVPDRRAVLLMLNGALVRFHREWTKGSNTNFATFMTTTMVRRFVAGDRLTMQFRHNGNGGVDVQCNGGDRATTLEAVFVGAL